MKRKFICIIFTLVLLIASFFSIKIFAEGNDIKIEEFNYISSDSAYKETISEMSLRSATGLDNIMAKPMTKIVNDRYNDIEYKEEVRDNIIYRYDTKDNKMIGMRELNYDSNSPKISEQLAKQKIQEKYENNNFPKDYKLKYIDYDEDDNLWEAKYEKEIDGIKNPYQGVKLKYDSGKDKLVYYRIFDQEPIIRNSKKEVDKNFLKKNEMTYVSLIKNQNKDIKDFRLKPDEAISTYVKPNSWFSNKATEYGESKEVIKAWKVPCDNGLEVLVDNSTGNIIGGDALKYAEALSCNTSLDIVPANTKKATPAMHWAFEKLKYRTFSRAGDATTYILKDWIHRGGPQYGFYITTHGGVNNGQVFFRDSDRKDWYPSDIKGNWDFVFINACHSKANETMANAFKIYNGSSKKAYLGWKVEVRASAAEKFTQRFADRIGNAPIQRIAKEVAEGMAEYVPIRFTGDKGWYGYAR